MKKTLLSVVFSGLFFFSSSYGQNGRFWTTVKNTNFEKRTSADRENFPISYEMKSLNLSSFKKQLLNAPDRSSVGVSNVIVEIPNVEGGFERFRMYEASNFDSDLQAQFPEIRSYVGEGIDDKTAILRLSLDSRGIQTVIFRADKGSEFIEPISLDGSVYAVYKTNRVKGKLPFTCSTQEQNLVEDYSGRLSETGRSSAGQLLTFRLALSCTAEYANYFGATSAADASLVLQAYNATMTRVNGVFEKDFAIHMNIIATTSNAIYYNASTDPYSDSADMDNWNSELQSTLTSVIGESNYDVGHLFGASGGGGNAGCIGCVCVSGQKGSGYTSPADDIPEGDTFDIDYVAHELGHQFGANHTFTFSGEYDNSGTTLGSNQVEVASGSTIMGYAGITNYNVQMHSDDYFHARSIYQVQTNVAGKLCPTRTTITHGAPVVEAGDNYTIPKSTPFMLTGSATDVGGGNLTYSWEQMDVVTGATGYTGANSVASETKATGVNWKSYSPTASPTRYLPNLNTVFKGSTTTTGVGIAIEALSSVARTLNFRLTARDNVAGQGQTGYDDMVVTVDATRGPLLVTSQSTEGISYDPGSSQTITWTVNNTNTSTGGANVDILFTNDYGVTWTTLLSGTPNNGSAVVTLPTTASPFCYIMVKASNSIFFNTNTKPFALGYTVTNVCGATFSNTTSYAIPDAVTNGSISSAAQSAINVSETGTFTDILVNVNVSHTYVGDLLVRLFAPDLTTYVNLKYVDNCNADNFNATFQDGAGAMTCTNNATGTFAPYESLMDGFGGMDRSGTWYLVVGDAYVGDTGTLNSWSLEFCTQEAVLENAAFDTNDFVLYPNPNNGSFSLQLTAVSDKVAVNVYDMRGRLILNKQVQANGLVNEAIELTNAQAGIYLVTIEDGARKVTKKIVVE